jgi:hypothetical protein
MRRVPSFLVPSPAMAVALVALIAATAGLALASSSGGPVIRACANKKTGALRLARKCRHRERSVSWNRTGPAGRLGAAGAAGPQGLQGLQGPVGPSVVSTSSLSGTPSDPPTAGYTNFAFAVPPATITISGKQAVFGIASTAARALSGQWGIIWALCSQPHGGGPITSSGGIFSWLGDASQDVAMTTNALIALSPGTYSVGPCLAVESLGKLDYNSESSTSLIVINT